MKSQLPAATPADTIVRQVVRGGRRPLLHIVVLYATLNPGTLAYVNKVAKRFTECGIDVVIQTTPTPSSGPPPRPKTRAPDITADHMASIIVSSHADDLIVIGDRNVKNRSVHSKRKKHLAEMFVPDVQLLIWKSWPQNPGKLWDRIVALTDEELTMLVTQFTGLKLPRREVRSCAAHRQLVTAYAKIAALERAPTVLERDPKKDKDVPPGRIRTLEYHPNARVTPAITIAPLLQARLLYHLYTHMNDIELEIFCDPYIQQHLLDWSPVIVPLPPSAPGGEVQRPVLQVYHDDDDGDVPRRPKRHRRSSSPPPPPAKPAEPDPCFNVALSKPDLSINYASPLFAHIIMPIWATFSV